MPNQAQIQASKLAEKGASSGVSSRSGVVLSWICRGIRLMTFLCGAIIAGLLLLGRFPDWYWKWDQFAHFVPQYTILLLLAMGVLLLLPGPRWSRILPAVILLPFCVFSLVLMGEAEQNRSALQKVLPGRKIWRLLSMNAMIQYRARPDILELIRKTDPDLIVIGEFDFPLFQTLQELEKTYPFKQFFYTGEHVGGAIYSKYPALFQMECRSALQMPIIIATLNHSGERFQLIGLRAPSPKTEFLYRLRNEMIHRAASAATSSGMPALITGDLNSVHTSGILRSVVDGRNLFFGTSQLLCTWPAAFQKQYQLFGGFSPFRIPIDHVLVTAGVRMISAERASPIDSDHEPLLVTFQVESVR